MAFGAAKAAYNLGIVRVAYAPILSPQGGYVHVPPGDGLRA
jgi:hypothetical protein